MLEKSYMNELAILPSFGVFPIAQLWVPLPTEMECIDEYINDVHHSESGFGEAE